MDTHNIQKHLIGQDDVVDRNSAELWATQTFAAVKQLVDLGDYEAAMRLAQSALKPMARLPQKDFQEIAWETLFKPLSEIMPDYSYQLFDFELLDYELYQISDKPIFFRGPRPKPDALSTGSYVTVFGASQMYGRFQQVPINEVLRRKTGIDTANLALGGAGPQHFFNKEMINIANGGQALILQVLSGRSIGCDEYPGAMKTPRNGRDGGERIERRHLLREIAAEDPDRARMLMARWGDNWTAKMIQIVSNVTCPVILVWISKREIDAWNRDMLFTDDDDGDFPHFVTREMYDTVKEHCAGHMELVHSTKPAYARSRFYPEGGVFRRKNGVALRKSQYYPPNRELAQFYRDLCDKMIEDGFVKRT